MATTVFRVEHDKNFSIISNIHLRDKRLSAKAKGLLTIMLSLPSDWDMTLKGLVSLVSDGTDSVRSGIKELEKNGYLVRYRGRNELGHLQATEYTVYESPKAAIYDEKEEINCKEELEKSNDDYFKDEGKYELSVSDEPTLENPTLENPILENPILDDPMLENTTQQSTKYINNLKSNDRLIDKYITKVNEQVGIDRYTQTKYSTTSNINKRAVNIARLMAETLYLCSLHKKIKIGSFDYAQSTVKEHFEAITPDVFDYVLNCTEETLQKQTVINLRQYLLVALFNANNTFEHYKENRDSVKKNFMANIL